jgi:hypothetical protein
VYNHKIKKIKFSFIQSKLLKQKTKSESICVLFSENSGKKLNKFTSKIKRSFFYKSPTINLPKNIIVGGGSIVEKYFYLNESFKEFFLFLKKQKSCIIFYFNIFWTLNKILIINLEKNNINFLVSLLLGSLKRTLSFFLPLKAILSNLKLESKK